ADELVRTSPTTPDQVADAIYRALTDGRPQLRYIVGKRARLVVTLRRYLPGELFERFYFGEAMRRVTAADRS
ncbi:MAG: SDR family NAD(P)-dependent oxidoreductase, partial [Anaerolineae bacterium]|nr:SDR family NAD(P)-dependent oxidoreductase [Anaerolineae bacterium]